MQGKILISTAYLPPIDLMKLISEAGDIIIESDENFVKQTYRNRCYILSAHGPQLLSVPVYEGSRRKVKVKEVRIDYSKRWQQVHLRAIMSSYRSSPYFDFYFENIERIISEKHEFLFELNMSLIDCILIMLKMKKNLSFSESFEALNNEPYDFRNKINPGQAILFPEKRYYQVFDTGKGFIPNLSIIDLIFNMGPESAKYL